ncbi:hypothetical protein K7432_013727 [Basidiobolus ranarum]|uniref:Uncharacterized protein n=1 Tax=Basidiobolus ranarum TaxID=34480 RepID=A0ABR2WIR8_9FUNG
MNETRLARMPSFELFAVSQEMEKIQNENMRLLTQLQEFTDTNNALLEENAFCKKKYSAIQQDVQTARNMYTRLETQLFISDGQLEDLRKENITLVRRSKEIEKKLEMETKEMERERLLTSEKLTSLQTQLRRLKIRSAPPPARNITPTSDTSSTPANEFKDMFRENSILNKTVKSQDKLILELREELEKCKQATQSSVSRCQEYSLRIASLENEKQQIKRVNLTLMEENESYQVLLHEKTMSGSFMLNPILQNRIGSIDEEEEGLGSLAKEILSAPTSPTTADFDTTYTIEKLRDDIGTFRDENRTLKDENKALALYINKILTRILECGQMEIVLSSDYKAPSPKVESEKELLEATADKNRVSFEVKEEVTEKSVNKGGRSRRSHSMSNQNTPSPGGVTGGFRAAWKRMSVSGWKTGSLSTINTSEDVENS